MNEKTKKVKLTYNECINMLIASTQGPGAKLPGVSWSCFLALISCDNELTKCDKAIQAAQEVKNIGEGKSKAVGAKLVESWEAFVKERKELIEKHAKKDLATGELVVRGNGSPIFEDLDAFTKEFESLKEKYKDAIDARDEQMKRVNEKLDEEVTITLPVITEAQLPDGITPEVLVPFAKLFVAQ